MKPAQGILEPEQLLSVLQEHQVEFVIIGGFSLAAHGFVRGTKDIDVVPEPELTNMAHLAKALTALAARIDLGDLEPTELGIEMDADGLAQGGNFCLLTSHGRLDVMQDVPGIKTYDELHDTAIEVVIPGVPRPLLFAGYEALIAMKSATGRDQDLIDIADLRRARGEDES